MDPSLFADPSLAASLGAFLVAAFLLTITPGLDTAMVLRTGAAEGPRRAYMAAIGIGLGCLVWGAAVAVGLGALLAASKLAYTILKWAGAAYLVYLGIGMILKPRARFDFDPAAAPAGAKPKGNWLLRGFLTNLLNPKIGVFYVSFLPQFVPPGYAEAPFIMILAALHVVVGLLWFAVLISAMQPLSRFLRREGVVRWLDRVTGVVFVGFGLRLAFDRMR